LNRQVQRLHNARAPAQHPKQAPIANNPPNMHLGGIQRQQNVLFICATILVTLVEASCN